MKNTVKLNESQLRNIVAESVKKVLKEYGGISLADYDNPNVRYNRLDGDEMSQLHQYDSRRDDMEGVFPPEYDEREEVLNDLLKMRNKGLITNDELDRMREVLDI